MKAAAKEDTDLFNCQKRGPPLLPCKEGEEKEKRASANLVYRSGKHKEKKGSLNKTPENRAPLRRKTELTQIKRRMTRPTGTEGEEQEVYKTSDKKGEGESDGRGGGEGGGSHFREVTLPRQAKGLGPRTPLAKGTGVGIRKNQGQRQKT